MNKFIAKSPESKKILNIIQTSAMLPVNFIIRGETGVGKKLLAKEILPQGISFDARFLETSLINDTINIEQYQEIIVTDIQNVLNKKEFLANLNGIKIVATSKTLVNDIEEHFAVKLDMPSLSRRPEDLKEIAKIYLKEANEIYDSNISLDNIDLDTSNNGLSLKKSIFKNTILHSLSDKDMTKALESFISHKLDENQPYKYFLKVIEIPLLNIAKLKFKSQLQMATKLNLNRITLRKKIEQYFGKNND